jgi:hypothetical protein
MGFPERRAEAVAALETLRREWEADLPNERQWIWSEHKFRRADGVDVLDAAMHYLEGIR